MRDNSRVGQQVGKIILVTVAVLDVLGETWIAVNVQNPLNRLEGLINCAINKRESTLEFN
jgi:hypothetical protein